MSFFRSSHKEALIPLGAGIVLLGVAFFLAHRPAEMPIPDSIVAESPSISAIPSVNTSGWKPYSNSSVGFSVSYDPTLTVRENDASSVQFYAWGPTQRGQTELYDGISLEVRRVAADSFEDYVAQQMDQFKNLGGVVIPLHTVTFNGIQGKSFTGSGLGGATEIFIALDASHLIEISYFAPDPGGLGFEEVVQAMLATFKLI
ncbi:MAG TPA: hypothetical protein VG941_02595 [Candidatus Paceibacterota bacterium]|nr:hypothetical protein [Candidatus Paceibacterota bacterium]